MCSDNKKCDNCLTSFSLLSPFFVSTKKVLGIIWWKVESAQCGVCKGIRTIIMELTGIAVIIFVYIFSPKWVSVIHFAFEIEKKIHSQKSTKQWKEVRGCKENLRRVGAIQILLNCLRKGFPNSKAKESRKSDLESLTPDRGCCCCCAQQKLIKSLWVDYWKSYCLLACPAYCWTSISEYEKIFEHRTPAQTERRTS